MRDQFADDDQDISIRRDVPFPASVRTAGIIWIVMGGLILVNAGVNFLITVGAAAAAGPGGGPQAAGGMCGVALAALFGAAFIVVGVQTIKGTAKDTLGNAIGSFVFGLLNGGAGMLVILAGLAIGRGLAILFVVLGGISLIAGVALLAAGVLALVGRENYKTWRRAQSRQLD